jgi:hypothetical protein
MSLAKDLDIYKDANQLLILALQVQAQVPRAYRVAVGQRISNECADILLTVARANAARGPSREAQIAKLLEHLEAATVLLRAAHNLRLIPTKVWASSIELTDSVGKQAHGWLKSARNFSAAPAA